MDLRNKGNSSEDESDRGQEKAYFPFGEDDVFLKKRPVNLLITILLTVLAIGFSVAVARHYYKKLNDQERLKWETGRLNKAELEAVNAQKHDLFQPLRENWTQYISSEILSQRKINGPGTELFIVVKNNAPQPLDKVVVSLYSLNGNGEASGVKDFAFQNIKPREIRHLKINRVAKSKDFLCVIKSITASSFSFCFNKDMETGGKSDPYYCGSNGN